MTDSIGDKRRTLNTFRVQLMSTVAIVTLGFGVVIALSLFVPLATQLSRSDLDPEALGAIASYALEVHGAFWPVVLVCLVASVASGFLLYMRMTGPLARYVAAFRTIARGESPRPITIRRVDYLHTETDALNAMLAYLAERERRIAAAAGDIERVADDLVATCDLGPEAIDLVKDLRDALKGLR